MKAQDAVPVLLGPRRRYADPAGHYIASYATPWRRAGAATVDWGLCYALFIFVSIPLGMLQKLGQISWEDRDLGGDPGHYLFVGTQVLTVAPIVAYWILLLPTSQTYGMRATGVRMVERGTGRGISRLRATARALLGTLIAVATYAVFLDQTAYEKGSRLDERSQLLLDGCYILFAVGWASALVMFVSPTRRSLFDRLFGTATLDELEALEPRRRGPWGPLDAFDTSR